MRIQIWKSGSIAFGLVLLVLTALPARAELPSGACAESNGTTAANVIVRRIVTDRMLQRQWALIEDCSHPERPLKMFPLSSSSPVATSTVVTAKAVRLALHPVTAAEIERLAENYRKPRTVRIAVSIPIAARVVAFLEPKPLLVRAGDRVHLWSAGANARLEIEAVSLDYGHAGQVIHLRRLANNPSQRILLSGMVVGADSAELLP